MRKANVLFFAADPAEGRPDGVPLEIDDEVRSIKKRVSKARYAHRLHFEGHGAARAADLLDFLKHTRARVVHFSGHCGPRGLGFVGPDGYSVHYIDAAALTEVFKQYQGPVGSVRLVVLAACTTKAVAAAIADVVGCAIGTTDRITDEAATTFNSFFYQAIAEGESVKQAYDKGCVALRVYNIPTAQYPQIYTRKGVDPAKLVLVKPFPWRTTVGGTASAVTAAVAAALIMVDPPVDQQLTASDLACGSVPAASAPSSGPGRGAVALASVALVGPAGDLANGKAFYRDRNYPAAKKAFERAAANDNGEAMGCLGYMYLNGRGMPPAPEAGFELVHKAAVEERDPHAMYALAVAYLAGQGTVAREHLARKWFKDAADLGYGEAMRMLGDLYAQKPGGGDYRLARYWYHRAIAAHSADARVDMGLLYEFGRGVDQDPAEAFKWYWSAAKAGSPRGMLAVGRSYQNGVHVPRDYVRAMAWYRRASDLGSADAKNAIGVLYDNGLGVRKSHRQAVRWYERAEKAGSVIAKGNLGRFARD
ncbi:MAG TPA: tetratricopeptide repeat protein [Longimicrobium sp.]|jgi:TPR repeat protein|uniref:tetratricopeptide repeat protein n=1 Tax=Longimicrobium sp. TaxID=2029185 RepID=UPI002ED77289